MFGVGNDTFDLWSHGPGTSYTDYITASGSDNTLNYSKSPGSVIVNLQTGVTSNYYGGTDYFSDIQNVVGSVYADTIIAQTGGGDTLTANGGNTTFEMSGGTNFINGGTGFSTLNYSFTPGPVNVNMGAGATSYYYGGTDHFSNIESIVGSAFNDRLVAGSSGAVLNGGAGNDTLIGGTGNVTFDMWSHAPGTSYADYITGGSGYNVLDYTQSPGAVSVNLVTGVATDYYGGADFTSNINQVNGTAFNDTLIAGAASAVLNGEAGSNTLIGGSTGTDTFELWSHAHGTAYVNYITPGKGYNILDYSQSPGAINVNLQTGSASDYYGGNDYFGTNIQQVDGSPYNDILFAGAGPVVFNGGAGNDTLVGGPGNDTFELWSHASGTDYTDFISGGGGTNTLDYSESPGGIDVDLVTGISSDYYGGTDYFSNIETVIGPAYASTFLAVPGGGDTFVGGAGGYNTFDLSGGTNYINGGSGPSNTLDYAYASGPVNVNLQTGTTSHYTGGTDHFSNIENVIGPDYGSTFVAAPGGGDTLTGGNAGGNTFVIQGGSNFINGGSGPDNTLDYAYEPGAVTNVYMPFQSPEYNAQGAVVGYNTLGGEVYSNGTTDYITNIETVIGTNQYTELLCRADRWRVL